MKNDVCNLSENGRTQRIITLILKEFSSTRCDECHRDSQQVQPLWDDKYPEQNVTEYSSTVLQYKFKVIEPFLLMPLKLLLHYMSEGDTVLFTPLQLSDGFSYFSDQDLRHKLFNEGWSQIRLLIFESDFFPTDDLAIRNVDAMNIVRCNRVMQTCICVQDGPRRDLHDTYYSRVNGFTACIICTVNQPR